jgi:long-chain fatty acid transport protein
MSKARSDFTVRCLVFLLFLGATSRDVLADGWKVQLQGVKALGLSYAGRSISLDDASTIWFNSAGMSRLIKRWTITTSAPVITYRLDYTDQGSTSLLGQPLAGSLTANGGRTSAVPHLYAVRQINDRVWAGFGFNAPYGLGSDYGESWVGRYYATKTELAVLNLNPSLAVKVNDRVSVGFGLDIQRSDTRLANMIDFGSIGAVLGLPLGPQQHDGRIELKAGDWAAGYDVSLAWNVDARARVGVTYRSQVEHTVKGTAHFSVPVEAAPLTAGGTLFEDTPASAVLPMPRELSTSVSYELRPQWRIVGDVTWTDWSRFEGLVVTFANPSQPPLSQKADFNDSVRGAVGVIYRTSGPWEFRAGGLYETTPVPDATRSPRLPEANNTGLSVGATRHVGGRWDLDVSFSHLLPHSAPIALQDPAAGALEGKVRWRLDILAASFSRRF